MGETWQVIDDEGKAHEVAVRPTADGAAWVARDRCGETVVHGDPRGAVVLLAQSCGWGIAEVLAPGVETRAAEVAHLEARRGALLAEVDRLTARDRVTWGAMPTVAEAEAHAAAAMSPDCAAPWLRRHVDTSGDFVEVLYLRAIDGLMYFREPDSAVWYLMRMCHEASRWRPIDADGCAMPRGAQ